MSQPGFVDAFSQTFTIDAAETALIVVDMQNATGNRNMGLGKLLAERGESERAEYRFNRIESLLVPNIQRLLASFRKIGASIIYITYGANAPDASDAPGGEVEPIMIQWPRASLEGSAVNALLAEWELWQVEACYCSVFDRCWTTRTSNARPVPARRCEAQRDDVFQTLGSVPDTEEPEQ